MSDKRADRIRHWLSVADEQDGQEKELAARYTAAASARLWVLHRLDDDADNAPDGFAQVRELADQADEFLDDDRQDEALFRRAQANLRALQLFENSNEPQRDDGDHGAHGDHGDHGESDDDHGDQTNQTTDESDDDRDDDSDDDDKSS
jgi:hypothetical protein